MLLLTLLACQGCRKEERHFGRPISSDAALPVSRLVGDSEQYLDTSVVARARIGSVCQTAGCWCILEDGDFQLHVSMTTFTLPRNVAGKQCRAEGKLVQRRGQLTLLATGVDLLDE